VNNTRAKAKSFLLSMFVQTNALRAWSETAIGNSMGRLEMGILGGGGGVLHQPASPSLSD
jgi:hypothetical protein